MEASEFRAWLERRGWTYADAAPHFRVDPSTVWRWQTGKRRVPGLAVRVVELTHELQQERAPCRWHGEKGQAAAAPYAEPLISLAREVAAMRLWEELLGEENPAYKDDPLDETILRARDVLDTYGLHQTSADERRELREAGLWAGPLLTSRALRLPPTAATLRSLQAPGPPPPPSHARPPAASAAPSGRAALASHSCERRSRRPTGRECPWPAI